LIDDKNNNKFSNYIQIKEDKSKETNPKEISANNCINKEVINEEISEQNNNALEKRSSI